jgi:Spy/CpxP family protein refolding chaperone
MKMKKTVMTVMAVFFMAVVSTSAFASHWGRGPGYDGPKGQGDCQAQSFRGINQLNLTPDQTARLAEIRNTRMKELMPLKEQMFAKRNQIKALWLDKTPDQDKIVATQKELRSLRDQMHDKITANRIESLKVLTPAQQEIVKAHFAASRQGRKGNCQTSARGGAGQFNFGPGNMRQ